MLVIGPHYWAGRGQWHKTLLCAADLCPHHAICILCTFCPPGRKQATDGAQSCSGLTCDWLPGCVAILERHGAEHTNTARALPSSEREDLNTSPVCLRQAGVSKNREREGENDTDAVTRCAAYLLPSPACIFRLCRVTDVIEMSRWSCDSLRKQAFSNGSDTCVPRRPAKTHISLLSPACSLCDMFVSPARSICHGLRLCAFRGPQMVAGRKVVYIFKTVFSTLRPIISEIQSDWSVIYGRGCDRSWSLSDAD